LLFVELEGLLLDEGFVVGEELTFLGFGFEVFAAKGVEDVAGITQTAF
jgi:hypothetical protein